jgi:predicted polyphosphate/ATP-dependent NAD kinase
MAVLGLPAGVKIHSSVYAVTPRAAGVLARRYLEGRPAVHLQEAEVMDLDEEALRQGSVSARLYGYLSVPYEAGFVQNPKSSSPATDRVEVEEIANSIASQMEPDTLYILGPGTTTRAITDRLGLAKTLTGVDAVLEGKLIAADASEQRLLSLLAVQPRAKIIITPVGGQGYLLGRGNQQISPAVIRRVGKENLIVASTVRKLISLGGRPLLVDTGDESTDRLLQGYLRIATGQGRTMVYRVSSEVEVTGPSDILQARPG